MNRQRNPSAKITVPKDVTFCGGSSGSRRNAKLVTTFGISRLFKAAIFIFWLVMMVLFLKREIFPSFFSSQVKGYRKIIPADLLLKDNWFGIYFKDAKIGYSHTQIVAAERIKNVSYNITTEAFLTLSILGTPQFVWLEGKANLDETYLLRDFSFLLRLGNQKFRVEGNQVSPHKLWLKINTDYSTIEQELAVPPDIIVASLFSPFNILANLKQRERFAVNFFNPLTQKIETTEVRVLRKDKIPIAGVLLDTLVVESEYQGFKTLSWIDTEKGDILKQETPLGWRITKEPQLEAMDFVRQKEWMGKDLSIVLAVNSSIALPQDVRYLKLRLKNLDVNFSLIQDERQKLLSRDSGGAILKIVSPYFKEEEALSLPLDKEDFIPFLESSPFIPSDDREIKYWSGEIIGEEKNSLAAVRKIMNWMNKNIRKRAVLSLPEAKEVLKTRMGDCNEWTYLFTALARAGGIPTKIISGLVYLEDRFFYHMWPGVYVGKWIEIDPVLKQETADVTHIKLVEGELASQLELAKVLGKIEIEVLEYR